MSTVARKFAMAFSGIALMGFVVVHLLGNLTLYKRDPMVFNSYAQSLEHLGGLLVAAEIGLLAVVLFHIYTGVLMTLKNRDARPERYRVWKSKGGDTPSNSSSRGMAITGIVLLVFLVIHLIQFRFGPEYPIQHNGETMDDLHRLVVEVFQSKLVVLFYVVCMGILGMHLRHGFWSVFQSLGATRQHNTKAIRLIGAAFAFVLALGFLFIPIWVHLFL